MTQSILQSVSLSSSTTPLALTFLPIRNAPTSCWSLEFKSMIEWWSSHRFFGAADNTRLAIFYGSTGHPWKRLLVIGFFSNRGMPQNNSPTLCDFFQPNMSAYKNLFVTLLLALIGFLLIADPTEAQRPGRFFNRRYQNNGYNFG